MWISRPMIFDADLEYSMLFASAFCLSWKLFIFNIFVIAHFSYFSTSLFFGLFELYNNLSSLSIIHQQAKTDFSLVCVNCVYIVCMKFIRKNQNNKHPQMIHHAFNKRNTTFCCFYSIRWLRERCMSMCIWNAFYAATTSSTIKKILVDSEYIFFPMNWECWQYQ